MDRETYRKIVDIQAKTRTRADLKNLFIKGNVYAKQKAMAEEALHSSKVSSKSKDVIRRHLDQGHFDRESLEVNQKVAAKLERNTEEAIRNGIRSGRIPKYDPSKDRQAIKWRSK